MYIELAIYGGWVYIGGQKKKIVSYIVRLSSILQNRTEQNRKNK